MEFQDAHKDDADKFAILTFHETGKKKTLKAINDEIKKLEENVWKREFPFPVLIDASGDTLKKWEIEGFPTCYLIDPEGNIHKKYVGTNPELEQILEQKIKEMPAPPKKPDDAKSADSKKGESGKKADDKKPEKKTEPKKEGEPKPVLP